MHAPLAPSVRRFGAVNWQGLWTLYVREVHRFLKVSMQTIFAPVITTLIFLAVFLLAMGGQGRSSPASPIFNSWRPASS